MVYENEQDNIYLNLEIRKSIGKTDESGNFIFEVEASNENLDLQNQIVLQNALLESKDHFLKYGVISYDHQHKRKDEDGNVIIDNSMVIGEPIDVKTDGKKTIVVGKLYKSNESAKDFIRLLKDGSTRVKASVGGIFPKVIKNAKTGIEKITSVLWNDLALTTSPVNATVGSAVFAKSMNPDEFVKALASNYETDSNSFTGGRTLIPENLDKTVTEADKETVNFEDEISGELIRLLEKKEITSKEKAIEFLVDNCFTNEKAQEIVEEIINQGGIAMKKSFSDRISNLLKSLVGNPEEKEQDCKKSEDEGKADTNTDFVPSIPEDEEEEGEEDFTTEDDEDEEEEDEKVVNKNSSGNSKKCSKGTPEEEEDEYLDGEEVFKSLVDEVDSLKKSMKSIKKQNKDLGNALVHIAKAISIIGNEQMPMQSVMSKSLAGKESTKASSVPTQEDLDKVQEVLIKSVQDGKIDLIKSSLISSDFQNCMRTGRPMKAEYFAFLQKEINGGK